MHRNFLAKNGFSVISNSNVYQNARNKTVDKHKSSVYYLALAEIIFYKSYIESLFISSRSQKFLENSLNNSCKRKKRFNEEAITRKEKSKEISTPTPWRLSPGDK